MTGRAGVVALLCGLALSVQSESAWGEDAAAADHGLARALHVAGKAHYSSGEYRRAAALFGRAYGESGEPLVLYNLAQALRLAGECGDAVVAYRRFLARGPTGPKMERATAWLHALEEECDEAVAPPAQVASASDLVEESEEAGADERAFDNGDTDEPEKEGALPPAPPRPTASTTPTPASPSGATTVVRPIAAGPGAPLRLGGVALTTAGVLVTGAGVLFGVEASRLADNPGGFRIDDGGSRSSRRARMRRWAWTSATLGIGAVAGGVALYYLGFRERASETNQVQILTPAGGGVGIAWGRTF